VLFLGAGVSKAVGIGDLRDLTNNVNNELRKNGYGELLQHIEDTLNKANKHHRFFNSGEIDIEVIFSILNARIDHISTLKYLGPYAIYLNELREDRELPYSNILQTSQDLYNIKRIIEDTITNSCKKFDDAKAKKYYSDLFEFEKETLGPGRVKLFSNIVTTNYDLVIEICAQKNPDIPWRMGFEKYSHIMEQ
jgi:hypothetical protein